MTIISGKQSQGQRDNQEDALEIVYQNERDPKSDILMLLADGMGGHAGGEVASNLALAAFKEHFVSGSTAPRPRDRLQEALAAANDALRQRISTQPDLKGMGCTLVAALKLGDRLVWVSVGDSSLFLLREGRIRRLNADHSLYGELLQMVAAGKITQEEADNNPRRNALRSALMGEALSLVDVNSVSLKPGDLVLSCSDGLDTLSQSEIAAILQSGKTRDMRGVASDLLNAVEAKGKPRQDNTTVIVYAHMQDGMSSLMRGSQWAFTETGNGKKTLKYVAVALGGLAAVAAAFALIGRDDPPPEQPEAPAQTAPAPEPQAEQSIGDSTVEEPAQPESPDNGDQPVTPEEDPVTPPETDDEPGPDAEPSEPPVTEPEQSQDPVEPEEPTEETPLEQLEEER